MPLPRRSGFLVLLLLNILSSSKAVDDLQRARSEIRQIPASGQLRGGQVSAAAETRDVEGQKRPTNPARSNYGPSGRSG